MKVYFVDDNLRLTSRVIEAFKEYYSYREKVDMECSMLLYNVENTKVAEETINYYKKDVFGEIGVEIEEFNSVDAFDRKLECSPPDIVMLDLCLDQNEIKKADEKNEYKYISMECMEVLEKRNIKYFFYSSYAGDTVKDKWMKRFREKYEKKDPQIYERNELVQTNFNEKAAKEILGV